MEPLRRMVDRLAVRYLMARANDRGSFSLETVAIVSALGAAAIAAGAVVTGKIDEFIDALEAL